MAVNTAFESIVDRWTGLTLYTPHNMPGDIFVMKLKGKMNFLMFLLAAKFLLKLLKNYP